MLLEGMVTNISKTGIKMVDIPNKFKLTSKEYRTVVSSKDRNYRLTISPIWVKRNGLNMDVGFKIISPTLDWCHLLKELNPAVKDIWGYTD